MKFKTFIKALASLFKGIDINRRKAKYYKNAYYHSEQVHWEKDIKIQILESKLILQRKELEKLINVIKELKK